MEDVGVKTILQALNEHSNQINTRLDRVDDRFDRIEDRLDTLEIRVDTLEKNMNGQFDKLGRKVDGIRVELTETQETLDFVSTKTLKHDKKLRQLLQI